MKKFIIILVIALVALLTWRLIVRHNDEVAGWQFIRRVTGFEFPDSTKFLAQYDNAEYWLIAVAKLPKDTSLAFAQKHAFGKENVRKHFSNRALFALALPDEYKKIRFSAGTLSAEGQTKYQSWEAILDSETGLLWIYVQYPDCCGDHSGWGPQPRSRPVSEQEAGAIIRALPEMQKLQQKFKNNPDDLVIDGPGLQTPSQEAQEKVGKKVWIVEVLTVVHDGPEQAHGNRWAFFLVNVETGEVFVMEPDLTTSKPETFIYMTLSEWRKQRASRQAPGTHNSK